MQLWQIALADVHHFESGLPRVVDHGRSPRYTLVPVIGKEKQEQGQEHEKAVEEDVEDECHGLAREVQAREGVVRVPFVFSGTGSSLQMCVICQENRKLALMSVCMSSVTWMCL